MGKIHTRVYHKDSMDEHTHEMPNGKETGPMLLKPDGKHSHLYCGEDAASLETSIAPTGVDHDHFTCFGETGGPVTVRQKLAEGSEPAKPKDQTGIVGGVHDLHKAE